MSRRKHGAITGRFCLRGSIAALLLMSVLQSGCSGDQNEAESAGSTANVDAPITATNPVLQTTTNVETIVHGSYYGYGYNLYRYVKLKNNTDTASPTYAADHASDCAAAASAVAGYNNSVGVNSPLKGTYPGASGATGCQGYAEYRFQKDIWDKAKEYMALPQTMGEEAARAWQATHTNPADPTVCYRPTVTLNEDALDCGTVRTCGYGGVNCTTTALKYDTCTIQREGNIKPYGYATEFAGFVRNIFYQPPGGNSAIENKNATIVAHSITTTNSHTDTTSGSVGFAVPQVGSKPGGGAGLAFSQTSGWYHSKKRSEELQVAQGLTFPVPARGYDEPNHLEDWMEIYLNYDAAIFNACPSWGARPGFPIVITSWPRGVSPVTEDFTGFFVKSTADAPWVKILKPNLPENQSYPYKIKLRWLLYPATTSAAYQGLYNAAHDATAQKWLYSTSPTVITVNGTPVSSSYELDWFDLNGDGETTETAENLITTEDVLAGNIPSTSCDGVHKVCSADGVQRFSADALEKMWSMDPFFDENGQQVQEPDLSTLGVDENGKHRFIPVYNGGPIRCDASRPDLFYTCSFWNTNDAPILEEREFVAASSLSLVDGVSKSHTESFNIGISWFVDLGLGSSSTVSWSQETSNASFLSLSSKFKYLTANANKCFVGNVYIDTYTWGFIVPGVVYPCSGS